MNPRVERLENRVTIRLEGDLVAAAVPSLRTQLRDLVAAGATELVLDLAATRMVDSTGIGLLMAAHNSLARAGGTLTVVHASPEIRELFQSMRLNQHITVAAE